MKNWMDGFEQALSEALTAKTLPVDEVLRYVASAKGKRLRPQLVFLSASLFGEVGASTQRTALFVELLHSATLLHDDVVDHSDTRRGRPSVNARWNNTTAVLAGDYLLSKAMLLLSDPADHLILQEMLRTSMAMGEGELLQEAGDRRQEAGDGRREEYLEIVKRKTAYLIRSCCVGGALSVGASEEQLRRVGEFGLNLGLVFQMRDDILDDDRPETTAMAQQLIPIYLERTQKALDGLVPVVLDTEALSELRELTLFCAHRSY